ncbi:helix-turn-helix domain-containing protein [Streptomyces aidingensis]|uniref:Putative peptidoglycan binding domain-containing protein n=1 Tax=Streptomyces aidingensis TaxID=910347 RepID=A0A1I1SUS9_9ACTN|nr:helix-turn-helix domain-containing protein [Streptomyces aidingensis]SFD46790.1 Putative peptidoglycan binding domain-containing protein [Streptomyces aidingensis]
MSDVRVEDHVRALAESLRTLKERTPHSYDTLAARLNISRSALHRYCTGKAVPPDFRIVELLAGLCGAGEREVAGLRRTWTLARESEPAAAGPPDTAEPEPESRPERDPDPGPAPGPAPSGGPPGGGAVEPLPRWRRGPWISAALLAAVLVTAVVTWNVRGIVDSPEELPAAAGAAGAGEADDTGTEDDAPPAPTDDDRRLFSPECADLITFGQHDDCVREVQELLAGRDARIGIDGQFGPETLRRVTAFQVLAGMDIDGIVGDGTKEALYSSDVTMATWTPEQVEARIREVFTEEPGLAVRIAKCQSLLDPLHILPNTDGSRNWGVFQISDHRLRDLRGTPAQALDPEWNIQAAHRLYAQNNDFGNWPHCLAAAEDSAEDAGEN